MGPWDLLVAFARDEKEPTRRRYLMLCVCCGQTTIYIRSINDAPTGFGEIVIWSLYPWKEETPTSFVEWCDSSHLVHPYTCVVGDKVVFCVETLEEALIWLCGEDEENK